MEFQEKLNSLTVGEGERVVGRQDLEDGLVRFSLSTKQGVCWVFVWDDVSSVNGVRMIAHAPAKDAKDANDIVAWAKEMKANDKPLLPSEKK